MKYLFGMALIAALAAAPQAASAQRGGKVFSVTNGTSHTLGCGVSRSGSASVEFVMLRPGEEWSLAADSRARNWVCESPEVTARYRLEPGTRYRLVENEDRRIVLVVVGRS